MVGKFRPMFLAILATSADHVRHRTRGLASLSLLVLLANFSPSAFSAAVVPALKSEWVYYFPHDVGYGIPDTGCDSTDIAAAQAAIAATDASVSNICNAQFSHWTTAWPNLEGRTGGLPICPAAGIPITGYQRTEERRLDYTYDFGNPCGQSSTHSGMTIDRHFFYYCADPVNYELFQPAYLPGPMIPACRLKSGTSDPEKQPRKNDCCNVGNPINIATGLKYQREADYVGGGASPLRFERHYPDWRHTYSRSVTLTDVNSVYSIALATREDGQVLTFQLQGGAWVSDPDVPAKLQRLYSGSQPSGWRFTDTDDSIEIYDVDGRLISVTERAGVSQSLSYGAGGRLTSVTDSHGRQLAFTYNDPDGKLATMVDPAGGVFQYGYDTSGRLATVTYPDTRVRTYLYNEPAHTSGANLPDALTGIIDENGQRFATFDYDALGRGVQSEHAGGADRVIVAYNSDGTRSITDGAGATRTASLVVKNAIHKVASVTGPACASCGLAAAYAYDNNGNLTTRTDFRGIRTSYSYSTDGRNLETRRTEAAGTGLFRTTDTQWHSALRIPTQITESNRRTSFTHDTNGNTLTRTVTDLSTAATRTWTYTYNAFGQVLTEDGPRSDVSDVTTYTYYNCSTGYECGQVQTITNALGHVTIYNTYNAHGQPLTITDPNGVVTTLTYDLRQRLTSRDVGGETTTLEYWPTGLLKKVTLPDSSYLQYSYDGAHRLTQIADNEGNRIVYTLDAMGNRIKEESFDPSSFLVRLHHRAFNTLNQLWKEIGAANTAAVTTTFGYDANSNPTSIAAPEGRTTTNTYDELNRLKQITDPASGLTKFTYDRFDGIKTVTDPRNKVTSYVYNNLGDLTQQTSPDTGITTNTYDSGGNLATSTDARSKTGTYAYDELNRLTQLTYPDQTITYTYDSGTNNKGRLMQVSDGSGSTSWTYTVLGRVASRTQSMGSVSKAVSYGYNALGQLTSLITPSGQTLTYGYANNRIVSLTVNGVTVLSNVLYDPFGPVRQWDWGNATLAVRDYDQDGNVAQIDSAGLRTYAQDDAFRITGITDTVTPALSWSYGYDLLDRLTSASRTAQSQSWTYDANGNRLSQGGSTSSTYTISSTSNRLSSISGALSRTYGYDAAGNTTSYGGFTFGYNDAGRMTSVSGSATATYSHNALGQRVKKVAGGVTTYFVYDEAGHLLGEYDGAGALIQETLWLQDIPVATLRPNGPSVALYYVHTDHLNTPRRISRPADDVIVWRWDSDAFGTEAANEDPDGDASSFAYSLRFPGQYFDAETGLSYNYFRDYDPHIGRYVESDPIGLRGGLNTYAYADSNPVLETDPLGLVPGGPVPVYVPRRCDREDWKVCEERCAPRRATHCYASLVKKAKGMRNGRIFWVYEKRSVNCRCEGDSLCESEPVVCALGAILLGLGACLAPEVVIPAIVVTTPVAAGAQ